MYDEIRSRLAAGETVVIDGATGTELQRRGVPMSDEVWCALATMSHGDILQAVHEDYIKAGAQVIIANTFATSPLMLKFHDKLDEMEALDQEALEIAHHARDAAQGEKPVVIAGSFSTMGPVPQGTNRNPEPPRWPEAEERALFARKAEALVKSGAELLAMEMLRDDERALWATEAAVATGLPVWIGLSVEADPDGEGLVGYGTGVPMDRMLETLRPLGAEAYLIMHSPMEITEQALAAIRRHWDGPMGVYPDSGYFEMPEWRFVDIIPPAAFAKACLGWRDAGAQILGGCCGIGPAHIRALTRRLDETA